MTVVALQAESVKYLTSIFAEGELTEHQTAQISGLLHVAADIEHMGDQCQNIAEFAKEKIEKGYQFSERGVLELSGGFAQVKQMVEDTIRALTEGHEDLARDVLVQEDALDHLETRLRKHHMERLERGECSPEFTVVYTDVLHNLEKIGDYCTNIAQAVLKDINFNSKDKDKTEPAQ